MNSISQKSLFPFLSRASAKGLYFPESTAFERQNEEPPGVFRKAARWARNRGGGSAYCVDSISRRPRECGACAVSRRRAEDGGGVWEEALLRGREGDGSRSRGELGWRGGPGTKGGRTLKRQERWQRDGGRGEGSSDVWYSSFFLCSGLSRGCLVPLGQGSNVAPKARPSRGLGSASAHPLLIPHFA